MQVAERMGVDEDTLRATEMGALLHDIGKISVPDAIINKPGKLDDEEWAIMRQHTVEGERMLQQVGGLLSSVGVVVRASHERWDGGGYPDGLVGEAIPVPARIVSACDAFNAMTTDRSYRKALPLEVAIAELEKNSGTQFAPDVVDRAGRGRHGRAGAGLAAGDRPGADGRRRAARAARPRTRRAASTPQLSKPRPTRSSSRSHGPRRPPLASARASARLRGPDHRPARRLGRERQRPAAHQLQPRALGVGAVEQVERDAGAEPARSHAQPGVADRVHRPAAERAAERDAEAAAGVDRAAPRVRDRDPLERRERLQQVPLEQRERLRPPVELRVVDPVAEVVDGVVAAEQDPAVGRQAVVVELVPAVGDPLPVRPADRPALLGGERLGHERVVVDGRDEPPDRARERRIGAGGEQHPRRADAA